MAERTPAVRQPYSAKPRFPDSIHKIYPVDNGSVCLQIDKRSDPRGDWERIDINVTDSVAGNGGATGFAKFIFSLTDYGGNSTRRVLTSNFGGNILSKATNSVQGQPRDREWHFYGGKGNIRGCFSVEKDVDSSTCGVAQLHFGFDIGTVYAITVKIRRRRSCLFTEIDGPTIQTFDQLQDVGKVMSSISSKMDHYIRSIAAADIEDHQNDAKGAQDH